MKKIMKKTKSASEIDRIDALIKQTENEMNNLYSQIGKLYINVYKGTYPSQFVGMVNSIQEMEQKLMEFQKSKKEIQEQSGIRICTKCGSELPKDALFCVSCGTKVVTQSTAQERTGDYIKCANCGAMVQNGVRFCTACGKPMEQPAAQIGVMVRERICPNCGLKQDEDAIFCPGCGKKL